MYTCTNDRYCSTLDTFDTVEDFVAMCRACFGEAPALRARNGDAEYVDGSGTVVLRRTSTRSHGADAAIPAGWVQLTLRNTNGDRRVILPARSLIVEEGQQKGRPRVYIVGGEWRSEVVESYEDILRRIAAAVSA